MIAFKRTHYYMRTARLGPVLYGLVENGWPEEGQTVHLAAMIGDQHRRIGEAWPKVSDEADERRARALISEHHDSMLALAVQPSAAAWLCPLQPPPEENFTVIYPTPDTVAAVTEDLRACFPECDVVAKDTRFGTRIELAQSGGTICSTLIQSALGHARMGVMSMVIAATELIEGWPDLIFSRERAPEYIRFALGVRDRGGNFVSELHEFLRTTNGGRLTSSASIEL